MQLEMLTRASIDPAVLGGLLLSAGGSGRDARARNRRFGELACENGPLRVAQIGDLPDDDDVIVATAVGAPGGSKKLVEPLDSVRAAQALLSASGCRPAAVMPGHVPGMYAWLVAAKLGIALADVACNGRGHPTVKMGSLGLAARDDVTIFQACKGARLSVVAEGNTTVTANLMRAAAVQNDGLVMAARGPLKVDFVRRNAALRAISYQLALGDAMLVAGAGEGARFDAAIAFTRGRALAIGELVDNNVVYKNGFDIGQVVIRSGEGDLVLGVYNEFMTAERDGLRLATFPDLIASLDPDSGEPIAVTEMQPGSRVAVLAASKRNFPLGAGVLDASVYDEVETGMGAEIARFALDPQA
jgi:uncharacterized protein